MDLKDKNGGLGRCNLYRLKVSLGLCKIYEIGFDFLVFKCFFRFRIVFWWLLD